MKMADCDAITKDFLRSHIVQIYHEAMGFPKDCSPGSVCIKAADALLADKALKIELVKPRYTVHRVGGDWTVQEFGIGWPDSIIIASFDAFLVDSERFAHEYCEWLNSKEAK